MHTSMSAARKLPRPSPARERHSTPTQCCVRRPRNRHNRLGPAIVPAGEGIVHICRISVLPSKLRSARRSSVNEQGNMVGMVKSANTSGRKSSSSKGLDNSLLLLDRFVQGSLRQGRQQSCCRGSLQEHVKTRI
jgi:hypothetical protein